MRGCVAEAPGPRRGPGGVGRRSRASARPSWTLESSRAVIARVVSTGAVAVLFALALAPLACGPGAPPPAAAAPPRPRPRPFLPKQPSAPALRQADRIAVFDRVEFSSPSAVHHDTERDLYWVSNVNGSIGRSDNKGFISRLDPNGNVVTLNFIAGGRDGVTLNSPRGLTVRGERLYVTDLDRLREFDAKTGDAVADYHFQAASELTDVVTSADGSLLVVDSGGAASSDGDPATTDALYRLFPDGRQTVVAKGPELAGPVALATEADGIWMVAARTGELLRIVPRDEDPDAPPTSVGSRLTLGFPAPAGIWSLPDATLLIVSMSRGALFRGPRQGPFAPIVQGLESPIDLAYDRRRNRLLIPLLSGHALAVFELPPLASPAAVHEAPSE